MNGVVMTTFTIEPENNITAFASVKEVRASHIEQAEYFSSQEDLGKLAVSWPAARLIEIWNSLAGNTGQEVHLAQRGGQPDLEGHPEPAVA